VLRYNQDIDILRVGDADAPSLGTSDPDIRFIALSAKNNML
jgi:hypothetical protein